MKSEKYNIFVNIAKKKQTHRQREQTSDDQWGEGKGEVIKRYKSRCIKQMSNKDILYNTENYIHCLVITLTEV